jgi:DNA polymerase III subunit beta
MKFTCTKENISQVLGLAGSIAGRQTSLPILTNVYIDAKESGVEIIGTNLEIAIKAHLRAKVEQTGNFTVPAKMILDYINLLPEEQVVLTLEGNELLVSCGNSNTKIKGMPSDEFPVIPEIEEQHAYAVDVQQLKTALQQVVIATSKNEIRPELAGISCHMFSERFFGMVLAATDSYRLAEKKTSISQGTDSTSCIIPARSAHEMIRILSVSNAEETNVRFWISENQIALRYGNVEMTSRLIEGNYPDYTQIIPEEFKTVAIVSSDELTKRIKAASLFTADGVNAVSFDLNSTQNTLGISSTSTQAGEHSAELDGELEGEENSILLNHRYVLDGLQQMNVDKVQFCVNSGDAPCLFRPSESDEYLYIVMPIRQ